MELLVKVFVVGICLGGVYCDVTTDPPFIDIPDKIDIPSDDIEKAMNLDIGLYTPMEFNYYNNQYLKGWDETYNTFDDRCIEEYIRCISSMSVQTPVCAYNSPNRYWGYYSSGSFCEIYYVNCRKGYRHWRVIDKGICRFWWNSNYDDVYHTFRRANYPLIVKLLKVLSSPPGSTEASVFKDVPNEPWTEPTTKLKVEQLESMNDVAREVLPYASENNQSLVLELLNILATQAGNTKISVSKGASLSWMASMKDTTTGGK